MMLGEAGRCWWLLAGLLVLATAAADEEAVCAKVCRIAENDPTAVMFAPGQKVSYQYTGQVTVEGLGVTESTFGVTAQVVISAQTPCDLKLQVMDLSMDNAATSDLATAVMAHDLHFSYQGGSIEQLCPHRDEAPAATNFKRGILSGLHMALPGLQEDVEARVLESDVGGECLTQYQVTQGGTKVDKSKSGCPAHSYLPLVPHARALHTDNPSISRSQTCTLTRPDPTAAWDNIQCQEEVSAASWVVKVTSSLTTQGAAPARSDVPEPFVPGGDGRLPITRQPLRMDLREAHLPINNQTEGDPEAVMALLQQLEGGDVGERPGVFVGVVEGLSHLTREQLEAMWSNITAQDLPREGYLDGVTVCESAACVWHVLELHRWAPRDIHSRFNTWLAGLHFHAKVHPDSLQHVMELANGYTDPPSGVVMAASTLVYRLCHQDPSACQDHASSFLEFVSGHVGVTCGYGETRERQVKVKLMLRALANAGVSPTRDIASSCYTNKLLSPDVRIAALQVNRRRGCVAAQDPWQILEDEGEEVGVRVAAYRALVPCADQHPGFFARIAHLLDTTNTHQVGSYIWSHVRNLAASGAAGGELAKLAAHPSLSTKFNANPSRASRNYRYQRFLDTVSVGGAVEGDVVFGESFVPRHAALNLTLDLMDKSVNVLEFGGDFNALEDHIHRLLGRESSSQDIKKEKIRKLQRLYDEARTVAEGAAEEQDDPSASLYLRVMGHEVLYLENVLQHNPLEALQQLVQDLAKQNNFKVVDQQLVAATQLGLPLRLRTNATASLSFTHSWDYRGGRGGSWEVQGDIQPSLAVAVDQSLVVDGYDTFSGVKRRSVQLTQVNVGARLEVSAGELIDLQINLPDDTVAKVTSTYERASYDGASGSWQVTDDSAAPGEEVCTPDVVSSVVGLKACVNQGLELTKADTFQRYQLTYRNQDGAMQLLFDTPDSQVDRKLHAQLNTRPENFGGEVRFPGHRYEVRGELETLRNNMKVDLKYIEHGDVKGELEAGIKVRDYRSRVSYSPVVVLKCKDLGEFDIRGIVNLEEDKVEVEGQVISSLQYEPVAITGSWKRDGDQHTLEGRYTAGRLGSASGTIQTTHSSLKAQLKGEDWESERWGLDVNLGATGAKGVGRNFEGMIKLKGSGVDVAVEGQVGPGVLRLSTVTDARGTEVSGLVELRNQADEGSRHSQLTLSLASTQLDLDYMIHGLYMTSRSAMDIEVALTLGSEVRSRASVTFLLEDDPWHLLAGTNLQLSDDLALKAGLEFDLSQKDRALFLVSSSAGDSSAVLSLDARYDPAAPLNVTGLCHTARGDQRHGIALATASNQDWTDFHGGLEVKFLGWEAELRHNLTWTPDLKNLRLQNDLGELEVTAQTSGDVVLAVSVRGDASQDPVIKVGVGRTKGPDDTSYTAFVTTAADHLLLLDAVTRSNNTFSASVRMLESLAEVHGGFEVLRLGQVVGSATAALTLPSSQTYSSDLSLNHTYDGSTRDVTMSSSYGDDVIAMKLKVVEEDGWFAPSSTSFSLEVTSPFQGLQRAFLELEGREGMGAAARLEWEDLMLHGELMAADNNQIEMKVEYGDGGTCDSHIHLYHKLQDDHYTSGASLHLTAAHDPWTVAVNTSLSDTTDVSIRVGAPVMSAPLQAHLSFSLEDDTLELEAEAGVEGGENAMLSFSAQRDVGWYVQEYSWAASLQVPGMEPLGLNFTSFQDSATMKATLDLVTSLDPINSVSSQMEIHYPSVDEFQFNLTHDLVVAQIELDSKYSGRSVDQRLKGNVNGAELMYNLEAGWDRYKVPEYAQGQLALTNLLDHTLNLAFNHSKTDTAFYTGATGSWDDQTFRAEHTLEYERPLEWTSTLQVELPDQPEMRSHFTINILPGFSVFESSLSLTTPWSESFSASITANSFESSPRYGISATYGDMQLVEVTIEGASLGWDESDLLLEVSSALFDNCTISWKHDLQYGSLVTTEVKYGPGFSASATSNLVLSPSWFAREFSEYNFQMNIVATDLGLQVYGNASVNSDYQMDLNAEYSEHKLTAMSNVIDGVIVKAVLESSGNKQEVELNYTEGQAVIPDFYFNFLTNDETVLYANTTTNSLYPKFDSMLHFGYLVDQNSPMKSGMLNVIFDLTDLEGFAFQTAINFQSNFDGYENYGLSFKTDFNNGEDYINAVIDGTLIFNGNEYGGTLNGSLALEYLPHIMFSTDFTSVSGGVPGVEMEAQVMLGMTGWDTYQANVTLDLGQDLLPQYAVFLSYNATGSVIKGYVIPGDGVKYEMAATLSESFTFNAQRVNDDTTTQIAIEGRLDWDLDTPRKQITLEMSSDIFDEIKEISAGVLLHQVRGWEASANFTLNGKTFTSSARYEARGSGNSGRIIVNAENTITVDFTTQIKFEFFSTDEEFKADMNVKLNDEENYIKSNIKASLKESYIRLATPFEGLEDIDMTVRLSIDKEFGVELELKVPAFCFTFDISIKDDFSAGTVKTYLHEGCSASALFEFNAKYEVDFSSVSVFADCYVKDLGIVFKMEGTGEMILGEDDGIKVLLRSEVYPDHSLGIKFNLILSEDDDFNDLVDVELNVYNLNTDASHFLTTISLHPTKSKFLVELLDNHKIEFKADHDFQQTQWLLDAQYDHLVLNHTLNAVLTGEANFQDDQVDAEFHFNTDAGFNSSNLAIAYDIRNRVKTGMIKLSTPLGKADGDIEFEISSDIFRIVTDMKSDLHSFKDYHIEFEHERKSGGHYVTFQSNQDDIKYRFHASTVDTDKTIQNQIILYLPFESFEIVELHLNLPKSGLNEQELFVSLNTVTYGDAYGFSIDHMHNKEWTSQELVLDLITPKQLLSNYSAVLSYNTEHWVSAFINNTYNHLGFKSVWNSNDPEEVFDLTTTLYLSLLGLGNFEVSLDVPTSQVGDFKLQIESSKTFADFTAILKVAGDFTHGNVTFMMERIPGQLQKTVFDINYEVREEVFINGQFSEWKFWTVWTVSGTSGNVKFTSNIENYENINGLWDMSQKNSIYSGILKIDMRQQGVIFLSVDFDNDPHGVQQWEGATLDVLFESPFTLSHRIQAKYSLRNPGEFSVEYKYGIDTFNVKAQYEFTSDKIKLDLLGNIPVPGISSFALNYMSEETAHTLLTKFTAKCEETLLTAEVNNDYQTRNHKFASKFTSPLFDPATAELTLSSERTRLLSNLKFTWGQQSLKAKLSLEQTSSSTKVDLIITTPFEGWNENKLHLSYNWSQASFTLASVVTKEGQEMVKIKAQTLLTDTKGAISFQGSIDPLSISGQFGLKYTLTEKVSEIELNVQLNEYEPIILSTVVDKHHIEFKFNYGNINLFLFNANYSKAVLYFVLPEEAAFNLTTSHTRKSGGHEFDLSVLLTGMPPVNIHTIYSANDGHKVVIRAVFGDKKYKLTGRIDIEKNEQVFFIKFESSEDPENPMSLDIKLDVMDFIYGGRGKNIKELMTIKAIWGDEIKLVVSGVRQKTLVLLKMELTTPFESLPELKMSLDAGLKEKKNGFDVKFQLTAEWNENVSFASLLKYKDDNIYLQTELNTSFETFETLTMTLQMKPSHFEVASNINGDEWKLTCNFSLSLPIAVKVTLKTPISGYETIGFTSAIHAQDGQIKAEFKLTWPEDNAISLRVIAEKWQLSVELKTPWAPVTKAGFTFVLRLEDEINVSLGIQWDDTKIAVTFEAGNEVAQLVGKYITDYETESVVLFFKYSSKSSALEIEGGVKTVYEELSLLRFKFMQKPDVFSLDLVVNDVTSRIRGSLGDGAFKLTVDIPFLCNLKYIMEAKNDWNGVNAALSILIVDTTYNTTIDYVMASDNMLPTFKFEVLGNDRIFTFDFDIANNGKLTVVYYKTEVIVELEYDIESVVLQVSYTSEDYKIANANWKVNFNFGNFENVDFNSVLMTEIINEANFTLAHKFNYKIGDETFLLELEQYSNEEKDFGLDMTIPLKNIFTEESNMKINIYIMGDNYSFVYEMTDLIAASQRIVTLRFPGWFWECETDLKDYSASAKITFEDVHNNYTDVNYLTVNWPNDWHADLLQFDAEIDSPSYLEGPIEGRIEVTLEEPQQYQITAIISYNNQSMIAHHNFHLNQLDDHMSFFVSLESDWIGGRYSLNIDVDWAEEMLLEGQLNILDIEHTIKGSIDSKKLKAELKISSPMIPNEEIFLIGKILEGYNIEHIEIVGELHFMGEKHSITWILNNAELKYRWIFSSPYLPRGDIHIDTHLDLSLDYKKMTLKSTYTDNEEHSIAIISYSIGSDDIEGQFSYTQNDIELFKVDFRINNGSAVKILEFSVSSFVPWQNGKLLYQHNNNVHEKSFILEAEGFPCLYGQVSLLLQFQTDLSRVNIFVEDVFFTHLLMFDRLKLESLFGLNNKPTTHFHIYSDWDTKFTVDTSIKSPFKSLEDFTLSFVQENDYYELELKQIVNGKASVANILLKFDFEKLNFENFHLKTSLILPDYKYSFESKIRLSKYEPAFVLMLKYPGGKIGIDAQHLFNNLYSSNARFIVSLPHEKNDIIALQYFVQEGPIFDFEVRMGKVGLTVSFNFDDGLLIKVNEMSFHISSDSSYVYTKKTIYVEYDLDNGEDAEKYYISYILHHDEYLFAVGKDKDDFLKVHLSWGTDIIFAITVPKFSFGSIDINIESSTNINEILMKVYLPFWSIKTSYGFHVRLEALEGGYHVSASGDWEEDSFYAEGTFALTNYYMKETMIFMLNEKPIGYRSMILAQPTLFRTGYETDFELLLPAQIVRWNTTAVLAPGDFDMHSRFTWNDLDAEVMPVTFSLNYDDNTFLGEGDHTLLAVFNHPEIKNIVFQSNITHAEDDSVHGTALFIDENAPEANITFGFNIDQIAGESGYHFQGNASQLLSGFQVYVNTQMTNDNWSNEGTHQIKYWSLTSESWEELNLKNIINTLPDGYEFEIDFSTAHSIGYTYKGGAHMFDNSAMVNLAGVSGSHGDTWSLDASVDKYMPEVTLLLAIGDEEDGVYEEGRVRVGLHNPLEMGMIVDHQKFGEWVEDAAIGLRLTSPHVLQFLMKASPPHNHPDGLTFVRLSSPLDQMVSMWWRDLQEPPVALLTWLQAEAPTALALVVNKDSVSSVLEKETENLNAFITHLTETLAGVQETMAVLGASIQDAYDATYSYLAVTFEDIQLAVSGSGSYVGGVVEEWLGAVVEGVDSAVAGVVEAISSALAGVEAVFASVGTMVQETWDAGTSWVVDVVGVVADAFEAAWNGVYDALHPPLSAVLQGLASYLDELAQAAQCGDRVADKLTQLVSTLAQEAVGGSEVVLEFVQAEEYSRRAVEGWNTMTVWLQQVAAAVGDAGMLAYEGSGVSGVVSGVVAEVERTIQDLQTVSPLDLLSQRVASVLSAASEAAGPAVEAAVQVLTSVADSTPAAVFKSAAAAVYQHASATWQMWQDGLDRGDASAGQRVALALLDAAGTALSPDNLIHMVAEVDPWVRGVVRVNQPLPFAWPSFLHAPRWTMASETAVERAQSLLSLSMVDLAPSPWSLPPPGLLLPLAPSPWQPLVATATVMGQHITTFDLRHYEFLGSCSYLFAKDFVEGDFEIVGVYGGEHGVVGLESVLVRGPGTDVILHVDGTVDVAYSAAKVVSEGGEAVLETSDLRVACSRRMSGCSFTVTARYFGRLSGMLGNYNYEEGDDMTGPALRQASSPAHLATMYAVSRYPCYQANQATEVTELSPATLEVESCTRLFLEASSSPFSACFGLVDPRPYFWHCVTALNRPLYYDGRARSMCDSATSYVVQCDAQGLSLSTLPSCVAGPSPNIEDEGEVDVAPGEPSCPVGDRDVPVGWSSVVQPGTNGTLDVGLVVEEASCNDAKDLTQMLKDINQKLRKAGFGDVRYSLLTYKGEEAGVPTAFTSESRMARLLNRVATDGLKDPQGGAAPLKLAADKMLWRPGVGRVLLQMSCQVCDDDDGAVAEALMQNDVSLFVLTRLSVAMEGPNKRQNALLASRVFGYDQDFVYTVADYGTFQGDAGQRGQLVEKGGSCLATIQASGGAIFNSNRWIPKQKVFSRKFLSVLSQRVAQSARVPGCHSCSCQTNGDGARMSCVPCAQVLDQASDPVAQKVQEDFARDFTRPAPFL